MYGFWQIARIWLCQRPHWILALHWRHNGLDGVSNNQPQHCLLIRLFGRRSNKTSKLCVTGLCAGTSPGTGKFPAQRASDEENVPIDDVVTILSMWLRHLRPIFRVCCNTNICLPYYLAKDIACCGPFHLHGLVLIPSWILKHTPNIGATV